MVTAGEYGSLRPGRPHEAPEAASVTARIADLLGVEQSAIDLDGNLIAQGLDSIRVMTLAGRWRREGYDVDFARLVAAPSVRAWVELLSPTTAIESVVAPPMTSEVLTTTEGEPFAMAPMQHAMWVGRDDSQQLGGVAAHLYVEFDGNAVDGNAVDPERLQLAAAKLADRHPMLRVKFLSDGTQCIGSSSMVFPIELVDLRQLDDAAVEHRLTEIREWKSRQQLRASVFELSLTILPRGRTRLHIDLDMQAADAMSYRTLTADLAALYRGSELAEIAFTYQEYRQQISAPDAYDADRLWWSARLPELPGAPDLPTIPPVLHSDPCRPGRRHHWLDARTKDALFVHSHSRGVTPAMALAASFADTVASWSAEPRFLLNVPLFGREPLHSDIDKVVGDFTSSLLLGIDLSESETPAQRAHAMQQIMHEGAAHGSYPGLSVLRDLSRYRGTQVLAPIVFTSALGLGELFDAEVTTHFGTPAWIISQGPQVLLDAQVTEFNGGILLNWDIREDAFRPGVIDAMFAHHIDEVHRLANDVDAWDATRTPLIQGHQQLIRDEAISASTETNSGEASSGMLHDGFFEMAQRNPDSVAVVAETSTLTYAQLRKQALAVAAELRAAGLPDGGTVAVMGPKSAEQLPALLGIHAAGGVYLPIGADQPHERALRLIADGAVDLALVAGNELPVLEIPVITVAAAINRVNSADVEPITGDSTRLAYVLFTSGSTGEPKGVEVTHDAAMNTVEFIARHFELGPGDRCLALSTLECDISVLDVFATLSTGGTIVVVEENRRRDPDHWVHLIQTHGVTVLHFLPGWLAMLLEVAELLPTLRVVPTGGDWVTTAMARRLRSVAPGVRFAGLGGATETAIHNTICEVAQVPTDWHAIPFGKPLPNNRCRVVSATGFDCPDWVVGELWVGGRGIAKGYRGRPDLTDERFVNHDGTVWYRTGDLARYWPDGTCEFVGRADDRMKISGYRVEPGEVEAAIACIDGVLGVVVVNLDCNAGVQQLCAAVQLDTGLTNADDIRQRLGDELPRYMIPQRIETVDRVPYTIGGKVDRGEVARLLGSGLISTESRRNASGPVEFALTAIIGEVLGLSTVNVDDDFFTSGGDSVSATAAVARIRQWLDIREVAVADIFANPTIEALAARLAKIDPTGRLDQVAEVFLEINEMNSAAVTLELAEIGRHHD